MRRLLSKDTRFASSILRERSARAMEVSAFEGRIAVLEFLEAA
jgi:hypothetical protein